MPSRPTGSRVTRALVLVLTLVLGSAGSLRADTPTRLGYQGRLFKADGTPAAGTLDVQFAVFEGESGGTELWKEAQRLAFSDGFYATSIGTVNALPSDLFAGAERYLEVTVGGETLSPRQRLDAVPYALEAQNVRGGTVDATRVRVNGADVQARVVSACPPGSSIRDIDADGHVTCEADDDTRYSAGDGLRLEAGTFGLTAGCEPGELLKWSGTEWNCAPDEDEDSTYRGGLGIALNGTSFEADTTVLQSRVTGTCPAGSLISAIHEDGSVACAVDKNTVFTAGSGLELNGTSISLPTNCAGGQLLKFDAAAGSWSCADEYRYVLASVPGALIETGSVATAALADKSVTRAKLAADGCTTGQVLKYSAATSRWECDADLVGTFVAGAGIDISAGSISLEPLGVKTAFIDAKAVTLDKLGGTCATGQVIKRSGTSWVCGTDEVGAATGGLSQVSITGSSLSGRGTAADPLSVNTGGITNSLLADGAVGQENFAANVAPFVIRGAGTNTIAPMSVKIAGVERLPSSARDNSGLTLTIINRATNAWVSSTNYDTRDPAVTAPLSALVSALRALDKTRLGVITSYSSFEGGLTESSRAEFRRHGLYKLASVDTSPIRHGYAAIFEPATYPASSPKAIEVMHGVTVNDTTAEIRGFLMDGSFVATGDAPSALFDPDGTAVLTTDTSGRTILAQPVLLKGGATVSNGLAASGGGTVSGGLGVTGGLTVSGGSKLSNGLDVTGGLTASGGSTLSGGVTVTGGLKTDTFTMPSRADEGDVLTADDNGVGTWRALPKFACDSGFYTRTYDLGNGEKLCRSDMKMVSSSSPSSDTVATFLASEVAKDCDAVHDFIAAYSAVGSQAAAELGAVTQEVLVTSGPLRNVKPAIDGLTSFLNNTLTPTVRGLTDMCSTLTGWELDVGVWKGKPLSFIPCPAAPPGNANSVGSLTANYGTLVDSTINKMAESLCGATGTSTAKMAEVVDEIVRPLVTAASRNAPSNSPLSSLKLARYNAAVNACKAEGGHVCSLDEMLAMAGIDDPNRTLAAAGYRTGQFVRGSKVLLNEFATANLAFSNATADWPFWKLNIGKLLSLPPSIPYDVERFIVPTGQFHCCRTNASGL